MSSPASCTIPAAHEGWRREGERLAAPSLAELPTSPWLREAPEGFALAGWVASTAKEAIAKCQASRGFQLKS